MPQAEWQSWDTTCRLCIQVSAGTTVTTTFRQLQSRCRVLPKKAPALIQLFHAEKDYRLNGLWTIDFIDLKHSEMEHKPLKWHKLTYIHLWRNCKSSYTCRQYVKNVNKLSKTLFFHWVMQARDLHSMRIHVCKSSACLINMFCISCEPRIHHGCLHISFDNNQMLHLIRLS